MATSSSTSTNVPKVSMLKAKTGFVIPKNKLSGSLIPAFKGVKKADGSDVPVEESTKQVQRKTKWGPDLTQDAAVRRLRALAYQARVDQITQLLKSGSLAFEDEKSSASAANDSFLERSSRPVKDEEAQHLEQEKREAIGEIVKLNPSYKVPSDYKPLIREARVPLTANEDAGYNFVFGPGSGTQKRVEKETGATIRVYGTKPEGGNQVEVTASEGSELLSSYKDLYVLVSADSYEKVDAAVVLIELLVSSVSGKSAAAAPSVSGDDKQSVSKNQETVTDHSTSAPLHNPGTEQPYMGSVTTPQGNIQPNPNPWPQMAPFQTPGFVHQPNSSAPIHPQNAPPFPFNQPNMPSFPGPGSGQGFAYASAPHNPNFMPPRSQPPFQASPNSFTYVPHPSNQPNTPSSQPFPAQGNQFPGPPGPAGSSAPNPPPGFPTGQMPDRPMNPAGNTGWGAPPGPPVSRPNFTGPNNPMQMGPPASAAPPSGSPLPPRPAQNQPSASLLVQQFGHPQNFPNNPQAVPRPAPSPTPPVQPGMPGFNPGGIPAPSFTPLRSMAGPPPPGPQQTGSGDFTFQPNRPHSSPHPGPRPGAHPGPQGPPFSGMQLPPAPPSFRPAMQGPVAGNQMGLQLPPAPYRGNAAQIPPPNMNAHMGARNPNFFPQSPGGGAPFHHQHGNQVQFQRPPLARPGNPFPQNQGFGNNFPRAGGRPPPLGPSGGPQNYDPFAPTSAPQHQGGNQGNTRRQESDPEYEDLMASVGVK